jgi:hypothetical protein
MFAAIAATMVVVAGTLAVVVPAQAQEFQNTQTNDQQACTVDCYNYQNVQNNNNQGNVGTQQTCNGADSRCQVGESNQSGENDNSGEINFN